jgi:hypothetical protein
VWDSIAQCCFRLRRAPLVVSTGVTGQPPDIDRFELGERLAQVFGSTHTLAIVAREESVNRLA